ncbi:MAG TPA: alpha/beta hydrolase [bacterium]|nr:alpha/beta hydrolase [bacterium]
MNVRVNGIDLAYDDRGSGIPLVLLHGFPFSRRMWRPQADVLSQACRLITPDLRGFGESTGTPSSLEELADDVHALVEHLGFPTFVLGGFSMGGYVAFRYVATHPDRLTALLLLDTRADADSPEARQRRYAGIERIQTEGPAGFLEDFLKLVLSADSVENRPMIVGEVRRMMAATPVPSLIGGLKALAERPDSLPLLAQLTVPTLIAVGDADKATPPEASEKMHEQIAGSTLVVVPGAGHLSPLEQPAHVNAAVLEFLGWLPSDTPPQSGR